MIENLFKKLKNKRFLLNKGYLRPQYLSDQLPVEDLVSIISELPESKENLHVGNKKISNLFKDSMLMKSVVQYFGCNYTLWRTNFFFRGPKSSDGVGWHHDKHFQDGDSKIDFTELGDHISIVIALADVTVKNGMLKFLCGSHRSIAGLERDNRPYHKRDLADHFSSVSEDFESRIDNITLKKGQFILFHSALLHSSGDYVDEAGNAPRQILIGRLAKKNLTVPLELAAKSCVVDFD